MKFFSGIIILLAVSGLSSAWYSHHKHGEHKHEDGHGHDHEGHVASSYTRVVKHDEPVKVHLHHHHDESKGAEHHLLNHHQHQHHHEHHHEHQHQHQHHHEHHVHHEQAVHEQHHQQAVHEQHHDDGHHDHHEEHHEDYYSHPQYKFDYGVKDHKSGDQKKHWEEREGDKVKGSYTFKEADGTTRVVEYTADKHNGFQATVKNVGEKHAQDNHHHHYNGHELHHHHF